MCSLAFYPLQRIEPYAIGSITRSNSHSEPKSNSSGNMPILAENNAKISMGRLSISQNSDPVSKESKSLGRISVPQNSDSITKESKSFACMLFFTQLFLVHVSLYSAKAHKSLSEGTRDYLDQL